MEITEVAVEVGAKASYERNTGKEWGTRPDDMPKWLEHARITLEAALPLLPSAEAFLTMKSAEPVIEAGAKAFYEHSTGRGWGSKPEFMPIWRHHAAVILIPAVAALETPDSPGSPAAP